MGRHREFVGVELFSITKNSASCLVSGCGYSYTPKPGAELHSKPLCDHLKRRHAEEYKKLLDNAKNNASRKRERENISNYFVSTISEDSCAKRKKTEVKEYAMSKQEMQGLVVEAVTVNGLLLSVFEKTAMSKLMGPIANKLGMSLSQRAVRSLTLQAAEKKGLELRTEFDKRSVCVKLDLCTPDINGKLKVVTASVKEMTQRATAEEIKSVLLACLNKIGIQEKQIYSLTTDNGSNVIKVGKLMQSDTQVKEGNSEEILSDNEENDDEQVLEAAENKLDDLVNDIHLAAKSVTSVRCALHTMQLCVHDVLKTDSAKHLHITSKTRL
ncbi:uncharacterized protein [Macrobrachium rosenbergii]|uniref:uncharacterized protein n=1 Tax=Macrobrachium rosenbergii TaxID=79674 RepID=UPI0034D6CCC5